MPTLRTRPVRRTLNDFSHAKAFPRFARPGGKNIADVGIVLNSAPDGPTEKRLETGQQLRLLPEALQDQPPLRRRRRLPRRLRRARGATQMLRDERTDGFPT